MFKIHTLYFIIILIIGISTTQAFSQDSSETKLDVLPTPTPDISAHQKFLNERRLETFNIVWQTISDNYFDQTFSGLDWKKIKTEYEPKVKKLKNDDDLHVLLDEMISRLNRSHFSIIPPEVFEAVQLAKELSATKSDDLENDNEDLDEDQNTETETNSKEDIYAKYGIGIELRFIDNKFVISNIEKGSSADKAGIKTGYFIEKVNGVSLKSFLDEIKQAEINIKSFEQKLPLEIVDWFFYGEKGSYIQITVSDGVADSKDVLLLREKVEGEYVKLISNVPEQYFKYISKSINDEMGYIKFNLFALPVIEKFCDSVTQFKHKKALIIDLRGNLGGQIGSLIGITGLLIDRPFKLGTEISKNSNQTRVVQPHKKNFKGKIIILTDKVSFSAAEMFASAFQENERAIVVGDTSAGETLPALTKVLPTGAVFLFPVSNYKSPKGNVIEGVGVIPNIKVKLNRESLLLGNDNQLQAAIKIANQELDKNKSKGDVVKKVKKRPPPPTRKSAPRKKRRARRRTKIRVRQSSKALKVVDAFIKAIGGREVLESIKSYQALGDVTIKRSGATIEGSVKVLWDSPNRLVERIDIKGVGVIREVYDGKDFFIESEFTGSDDIKAPIFLEDKSLSAGFYEMLNIRKLYSRIIYQGIYKVNGKKSHLLEATTAKGLQVAFVFDVNTKLLVKRTSNASGNMEFDNYKKITGGAILPFSIVKSQILAFDLDEIIPNFEIDETKFSRKVSCFDKVD